MGAEILPFQMRGVILGKVACSNVERESFDSCSIETHLLQASDTKNIRNDISHSFI